jgi:protein-tyrosine-phosphatase
MVDQDTYEIKSAGSSPSGKIDSTAINLMSELGYDLSSHSSTSVHELSGDGIALLVSMGCGDACPTLPAKKRIDWKVADPKRMSLEDFRGIRDLIRSKVGRLFADIGNAW